MTWKIRPCNQYPLVIFRKICANKSFGKLGPKLTTPQYTNNQFFSGMSSLTILRFT